MSRRTENCEECERRKQDDGYVVIRTMVYPDGRMEYTTQNDVSRQLFELRERHAELVAAVRKWINVPLMAPVVARDHYDSRVAMHALVENEP